MGQDMVIPSYILGLSMGCTGTAKVVSTETKTWWLLIILQEAILQCSKQMWQASAIVICDQPRNSRDLWGYSTSINPNVLGWAQPQEQTPPPWLSMACFPPGLGLTGPCRPWGFSAISVPSPALSQAYQRWLSSPELFVPTEIRCKEQPSLSSLTARSLTWTHRFSWSNARVWSGYSKAEEIKKGLLVQWRGKWQVLLFWALLFPAMR